MQVGCAALLLMVALLVGCRESPRFLRPQHIETPTYDFTAHVAHLEGHIVITATIDDNGRVVKTSATGQPLLANLAMKNLRSWMFEKPRHLPWEQTIVYDYRLEGTASCEVSPSLVTFDLPDRVTIVANPVQTCDPSVTMSKRRD